MTQDTIQAKSIFQRPVWVVYDHTSFSIFDLLWVRDFAIEISTEYDYKSYDEETELDNWD